MKKLMFRAFLSAGPILETSTSPVDNRKFPCSMSEIPFLRVYVFHSQEGFSLWKQSLHRYEILIFEHSCCKDSIPTDDDRNGTRASNNGLKKAITATENRWSFWIHLVRRYEILETLPTNLTLASFSNEDGNGPGGGYSQKNWVGVCSPLPKTLTLLWPKSAIFPALFMTWPKIWYPIYDLTKNLIPYLWPDP